MLGGMRHLIWDTGRGFEIWQVNLLSWLHHRRLRSPLTLASVGSSA